MRQLARILAAGLLALAIGCSDPPEVLQGKVVSYDTTKRVVVLEDEVAPHMQRQIDIASAEISGQPAAGHVLRVAYRQRDGRLVGGRVQNLSTQKKQK